MGVGAISGSAAQPVPLPPQTEAVLNTISNAEAQVTQMATMLAGGGAPGASGLGQILDLLT
jgi:hypothetical protein